MKEFLSNNAFNIGALLVGVVIAWVTIQANSDEIVSLHKKIIELEDHKVGNSTMILKEQAMDASFHRIDEEIDDITEKLNKKAKLIAAQQTQIHLMAVQIAVQQAQINQGVGERNNIWQNYNRINCK